MDYLYFNQHDSIQHFDLSVDPEGYMKSGETFFHVYNNGELITLNHYSSVKPDYTLNHSGINLLKEEREYEFCEALEKDGLGHTHHVNVEWKIVSPEGFVCLNINGFDAKIEWSDGQIKDLDGEVAQVFKKGDCYHIREDLTEDMRDRKVEITRLEKLRTIIKDDTIRQQLTWEIVGLKQKAR